jgi:hypothetical protein
MTEINKIIYKKGEITTMSRKYKESLEITLKTYTQIN